MAEMRVTMAQVAERFATGTLFTTRNTLHSVEGVTGQTGLPRNFARLYRHWVLSGNRSIAQTVLGGTDGQTVIGWYGHETDPRTGAVTRVMVIPVYESADRTANGHRLALVGKAA
jgi:hypothetical protein